MDNNPAEKAFGICRTCLQYIWKNSSYFYLNTIEPPSETVTIQDKLRSCVPELDLSIAPSAIICTNCFVFVNAAYTLRKKCFETETQIYKYQQCDCSFTSVDLMQVKLNLDRPIVKTEVDETKVCIKPDNDFKDEFDNESTNPDLVIELQHISQLQGANPRLLSIGDAVEELHCDDANVLKDPLVENSKPVTKTNVNKKRKSEDRDSNLHNKKGRKAALNTADVSGRFTVADANAFESFMSLYTTKLFMKDSSVRPTSKFNAKEIDFNNSRDRFKNIVTYSNRWRKNSKDASNKSVCQLNKNQASEQVSTFDFENNQNLIKTQNCTEFNNRYKSTADFPNSKQQTLADQSAELNKNLAAVKNSTEPQTLGNSPNINQNPKALDYEQSEEYSSTDYSFSSNSEFNKNSVEVENSTKLSNEQQAVGNFPSNKSINQNLKDSVKFTKLEQDKISRNFQLSTEFNKNTNGNNKEHVTIKDTSNNQEESNHNLNAELDNKQKPAVVDFPNVQPSTSTAVESFKPGKKENNKKQSIKFGVNYYQCSICKCKVKSKLELMSHLRVHMNKKQERKVFQKHWQKSLCNVKSYKCLICPFNSRCKSVFALHMRSHALKQRYKQMFKYIDIHRKICPKPTKKINMEFKNSKCKAQAKTNRNKTNYKCNICNFIGRSKSRLTLHLRIHTGEKPFKCEVCKFSSSYKSSLKNHAKIHTGEKRFRCMQCDYRTYFKNDLISHMAKHTGVKPHKCGYCSFASARKGDLTLHLLSHQTENKFRCTQCDYSTNRNSNIKQHYMIHNGEKPFKCTVCEYSTIQRISLTRHMAVHTGIKLYRCNECPYQANHTTDLKNHKARKHTGDVPYKCSKCNYKTARKWLLTSHLMTHVKSSDKPFKCTMCPYTTSRNYDLKCHIAQVHNNDNPLKCTFCDFRTAHKGSLNRHISKQHKR